MPHTKLGRQTVNAVRFVEIVQVLVRHGFADMVRRVHLDQGWPGRLLQGIRLVSSPQEAGETFGTRLRKALTELGPTFIKLGQVLSTRPDLIGHTVAEELSGLLDEVTPLDFELMRPIIEEELGRPLPEMFSHIETAPVASASLSQVYRATLPTGETIAVKVQRPGIETLIESDISLMEALAEWVAQHNEDARFFNPRGIVEEFARSIRRELDFNIEAMAARRFAENFSGDPGIVIPKLFPAYSARRISSLEWIDGVPINDLAAYSQKGCDPAVIARVGCRALCDMVFRHRFFHADPHPGNIFLLEGDRLAFLDLGMAGHLEKSDILAFSDILLAVFREDTAQCLNAVLELSANYEPGDHTRLAHEISEYIAFEAPLVLAGGQVVRGLEIMVQIMRRHGLELAPRFALLLKALVTIEKVGHTLNPAMDMTAIIRPYAEDLFLERYTPVQLLKNINTHLGGYVRLSRQAPVDVAHLLRQLRAGNLRFHIHHEHLETLANTIERSSKRSSVAMIIASLIIGSSLLFLSETPFARLGIIGYFSAGLLGFLLIISILWGGNR